MEKGNKFGKKNELEKLNERVMKRKEIEKE